jgi:mono/diheme cytochrome c family protein
MKPVAVLVTFVTLGAAVAAASFAAIAGSAPAVSLAERGRYIVTTFGCNDCHTPWKLGPNGPEPDMTRLLSGHPQDLAMPPAPKLPDGPWMIVGAGTNTAWAGPWGVSFTANLTPDDETGLGTWTEQQFIDAMRTGRHQGRGREILPPMPAMWIGKKTDADLRAIYAYLRTIPPISNRVPAPVPPDAAR